MLVTDGTRLDVPQVTQIMELRLKKSVGQEQAADEVSTCALALALAPPPVAVFVILLS